MGATVYDITVVVSLPLPAMLGINSAYMALLAILNEWKDEEAVALRDFVSVPEDQFTENMTIELQM